MEILLPCLGRMENCPRPGGSGLFLITARVNLGMKVRVFLLLK